MGAVCVLSHTKTHRDASEPAGSTRILGSEKYASYDGSLASTRSFNTVASANESHSLPPDTHFFFCGILYMYVYYYISTFIDVIVLFSLIKMYTYYIAIMNESQKYIYTILYTFKGKYSDSAFPMLIVAS